MSLPEWLVLAILSQQPAHGFAVAQLTAPDGDLGRVWQIPKAVVYRAIGRLLDADLIAPEGTERGQGPQRTVYTATAERAARRPSGGCAPRSSTSATSAPTCCSSSPCSTGRATTRPTCSTPSGRSSSRSRRRSRPARRASAGFDATLLAWRRATAVAALDFIDRIRPARQ